MDKEVILDYLKTDRSYAAYAIGDLQPELFGMTEWAGAENAGQIRAIALLYKGLDPPALFLMGEPAGLTSVLRLRMRPRRVYLTCREQHRPVVQAFYNTESASPMWRMTLTRRDFQPSHSPEVISLSPRHTEELKRLYAQGGGGAFSPIQLATGVFFGVRDRDRIVAAAGTHLVSLAYGVAAVGNVYTDRDFRGRGYGTSTTCAVVADLFQRGIRHIVLNVAQANAEAIRIYQTIGFTIYCPFVEMLALRKG
jgi:RimJ/RimL family protein N-acetyltransferase